MKYELKVDTSAYPEAASWVEKVINHLIGSCGVSQDEAIDRVNRMWRDDPFEPDDLRLHEFPEEVAEEILYGRTAREAVKVRTPYP